MRPIVTKRRRASKSNNHLAVIAVIGVVLLVAVLCFVKKPWTKETILAPQTLSSNPTPKSSPVLIKTNPTAEETPIENNAANGDVDESLQSSSTDSAQTVPVDAPKNDKPEEAPLEEKATETQPLAFSTSSEMMIARLANGYRTGNMVMLPGGSEFYEDMAKALSQPIEIYEDDSDTRQQLKEDVADMKEQLKGLMKDGVMPVDALKQAVREHNEMAKTIAVNKGKCLNLIKQGKFDEARVLADETNKAYEGLTPKKIDFEGLYKHAQKQGQ